MAGARSSAGVRRNISGLPPRRPAPPLSSGTVHRSFPVPALVFTNASRLPSGVKDRTDTGVPALGHGLRLARAVGAPGSPPSRADCSERKVPTVRAPDAGSFLRAAGKGDTRHRVAGPVVDPEVGPIRRTPRGQPLPVRRQARPTDRRLAWPGAAASFPVPSNHCHREESGSRATAPVQQGARCGRSELRGTV